MDTNSEGGRGIETTGPTLYVESNELDPTEAVCTEVLEDADAGAYRVVQLTSSRSFDSLQRALDVQLAEINDPSETAVIILSPDPEDDSAVAEVGEDVPLYGYWVDPEDLTGISIAFSRLIQSWEDTPGETRICLRNVESLLPYHDTELVYRFLNTILATLQGAGAEVHAHLRPTVVDDRAFELFSSLFAEVVDTADTDTPDRTAAIDSHPGATAAASLTDDQDDAGTADDRDRDLATMSDAEIDSFLDSAGYGVLAFAGSSPYAIPVSYGYDPERRVFYMQLSAFDGSEKRARLAESSAVSFVVTRYERPDRWRSVVARGTLTPASETDIDEAVIADEYASSDLASVDVFTEDLSVIEFEWYVLDPSEISGRRSAGSV